MSPHHLLAEIADDLDQMRDVLIAMDEDKAETLRLANTRIAHFNRLHVQITEAVRSMKRIEDDPAHHWHQEAVA